MVAPALAGALSHASFLACKAATVSLSFCIAGVALSRSSDLVPQLRIVSEAMVYVPSYVVMGHGSSLPEPNEAVVPVLMNLTTAPQAAPQAARKQLLSFMLKSLWTRIMTPGLTAAPSVLIQPRTA